MSEQIIAILKRKIEEVLEWVETIKNYIEEVIEIIEDFVDEVVD